MKRSTNIIFLLLLLVFACEKDEAAIPQPPPPPPSPVPLEPVSFELDQLVGNVQKGPFLSGSTLTLSEIDSNFVLTGRSFPGDISSNLGDYRFGKLELVSSRVLMQVNGFYFNEVTGKNSAAQLSLSALVDLQGMQPVNINILGHLARFRVEHLMGEGVSFSEATLQAHRELIALFDFSPPQTIGEFEQLSISRAGEDNAILLAASVIFQGRRSVAELSQLLANVKEDMLTDGTLDDPDLGSALINDIRSMDLGTVRDNLEKHYADLGETVTIPPFEKYIRQFIENTDFAYTFSFEYPKTGAYGRNLLSNTVTTDTLRVETGKDYTLTAIVPEANSLRIKMVTDVRSSGTPIYGPFTTDGWQVSPYDRSTGEQWFTLNKFDSPTDVLVGFLFSGWSRIEYYENNETQPTRVQHLIWGNPQPVVALQLPASGAFGPNLLALVRDGQTDFTPGVYSLTVYLQGNDGPGFNSTDLFMHPTLQSSHALDQTEARGWRIMEPVDPEDLGYSFDAHSHSLQIDTFDVSFELKNVRDSMYLEFLEIDNNRDRDDSFRSTIRW